MNVIEIFEEIKTVDFLQTQKTAEIQEKIYNKLEEKPNNPELLILLMQAKIMLAKKEEAIALANKIWEDAEDVNLELYLLYINNLINIGLIDMATTALKPFFEDMQKGVNIALGLMIKFATIIGSLHLMSKIEASKMAPQNFSSVVEILKQAQYHSYLRDISKIILNLSGSKSLQTEVFFYDSQDEFFWGIDIYINDDEHGRMELENKINNSINAYLQENSPTYWLAPIVSILDIYTHKKIEQ